VTAVVRGRSIQHPFVLLILAAASWGVGTVLSKRALDDIPPLTLLPIQLVASLAVLAVVMRRRRMSFRGSPKLLARLGILNPGLAYVLSLLGLVSISASLSVLLWAIEPVAILILATWLLRERVTPLVVLLSFVALVGMVIVVFDPASSGQLIGIALTLAGVGCCAVYAIVARRWLGTADSTAEVVLAQQLYALAFSTVAVVGIGLLGGAVRPESVSPVALVSAIGSGVLYYAAAYWCYLSALRKVPASVAAISFYLVPVFGVGAGHLLLGERLDTRQWLGAAVVLSAVLAVGWLSGREAAREKPVVLSVPGG
jgi:probable blue pigment (indigoidine) exporter